MSSPAEVAGARARSVLARVGGWLSDVPVDDPIDRTNAPAVQVFCVGLAAFLLHGAVRGLLEGSLRLDASRVIDLAVGTVALACVALVRWGRYRLGVKLLAATVTAIPGLAMIATGLARHGLALRLVSLPLAFGALVLGRRALWSMAAAFAVAIAAAEARDRGLLGSPAAAPLPPTFWLNAILSLLLLAVILDRFGLALREALSEALRRRTEAERAAAEASAANQALREEMARRERVEARLVESQKLEAVGRLAGGVAHDFNNVVGAILGFADLARESLPEGSPAREDLAEIRAAGERGASLTRQLLAFSRRQVSAPRVLFVEEQLAELRRMLERLLGDRAVLRLELEPSPWPVRLDPGQLQQVVTNLVVNARDAMSDGGTVTVATSRVPGDASAEDGAPRGDQVVLSVSDTGVGMDAATRARIFEPFFTTKAPGGGTGLGLATCYGIVQQAGGRIDVESVPGRGTTFRVHLPRATPAPGAPDALAPAERIPTSGGSETVLLVEDERALRELAARVLWQAGYRVMAARSAELALEIAAAEPGPIHLLVADVALPGRSGRELADELRATRPEARVLFVSGHADDAVLRLGVRREEVRFLGKPFTGEALLAHVRGALDATRAPVDPSRG